MQKQCPYCHRIYHTGDFYCLNDNHRLVNIDEQNNKTNIPPKTQPNTPKCPTCGSTKVHKIGVMERGVSVGLFGLFSSKIGKTMKCNNCGYKW